VSGERERARYQMKAKKPSGNFTFAILLFDCDAAAAAEDERCAAPHKVRDAAEKKCIRISDRLILPARFPPTCHIPTEETVRRITFQQSIFVMRLQYTIVLVLIMMKSHSLYLDIGALWQVHGFFCRHVYFL
jgi:hypothetical protein